jgi:hypothetical protein
LGVATTRTGASLRIRTQDGSAHRVTDLLGIEPSRSFEIGDVLGRISPRTAVHAQWSLDSPIDERPLEVHLGLLCDQLEPVTKQLHDLAANGYVMDWFCFVDSGSQGSIELDHALLQRLAAFPVDLTLDLYGGDDADEG